MLKNVVEGYDKLTKRDLRILRIIEVGHLKYEYVPEELVVGWARYRKEEVVESIRRLHYYGFLRRNVAPYRGWKITALGYDVLALHTLVLRRKILSLSPTPLGVGKESVVYAGVTPSGFKVALKFHRGRVSVFRYERPFLRKVSKYRHLADVFETRLSALAEYFALSKVFEAGGWVPEPIAYNRHVVLMSYVEGVELYRSAEGVMRKIADDVVHTISTALRIGIIHGDLSPYNIIAGDRGYVIDWPQWVPTRHPKAEYYLRRDLATISAFFKKWGVEIPVEELAQVVGESGNSGEQFLSEIYKQDFL